MGRQTSVVRISSKGQIVIPMAFRRLLGLKTGQSLVVRTGTRDEIVLRLLDRESADADDMRRRLQAAGRKLGGDPLAAFEERRRRERLSEVRKHERWSH